MMVATMMVTAAFELVERVVHEVPVEHLRVMVI